MLPHQKREEGNLNWRENAEQGCKQISEVSRPMSCGRRRFLEHFDKLIARRADEIGASVAPMKVYWSRRLSLTLQCSMAQAVNIRMAML